jgi:hypothetical protein
MTVFAMARASGRLECRNERRYKRKLNEAAKRAKTANASV